MQIGAVIAKVITTALLKIGLPKAVAALVTKVVISLALSAAASAVMRAFSPKPPAGSIDQGQELRLKYEPAYPREVAVGIAATGGSIVYSTVSGSKNEYLWRVIALSDNEIDEVTQIWADGKQLTFSGDWHSGYAACTSHFQKTGGADCLSVRVYKGTESQTYDTGLAAAAPSGEWTSAMRGRGVAYAIVKMEYDADAFQGGEPQLVFVMKGAVNVWDPRLSGGVGGYAWTENAALIGAQALKGFSINGVRVVGLGAAAEDVPDADLEAAADECDETVTLDAGGSEARYRAGGMISGRENAREILTNLTAAMAGQHIDRGGEIVFLPGVERPVVNPLTRAVRDSDFLADEPINYTGRKTADELANCIVSSFVSPAHAWQEQPLPPQKDAAAILEDGGERFEINRAYRYVTSSPQGQRLDTIALREARKMGRGAFAAPLWALEWEPGDWFEWESVRFSGALETRTFRVESIELAVTTVGGEPMARAKVTCTEIGADVYDWDEDESELADDEVSRPTLALEDQGPVAAALLVSGAVVLVDDYTPPGVDTGLVITANRVANTKNRSGVGSVTSDAFTLTVDGGSGTYTYEWEQVSGDAMTINSPSASSTTFSVTLGIAETKTGFFDCLVTDTVEFRTATIRVRFSGVETT